MHQGITGRMKEKRGGESSFGRQDSRGARERTVCKDTAVVAIENGLGEGRYLLKDVFLSRRGLEDLYGPDAKRSVWVKIPTCMGPSIQDVECSSR